MTFQKYQTGNNVVGFLDAGLSASGTTMIMKAEYAELFPAHAGGATKDYLLTLEQIDTVTKAVLKREIVKVKGRAGNIFTIERGAGTCPGSDTATEQGNNTYPFSSGDKVILSITAENDKDIKDELERLETAKKDDFDFADIPLSSLKDGPSETPANNEYLKWNATNERYEPGVVEAVDIPEVTSLANSDYIAGEDITKGDSLFAETGPTFAEAILAQNICDVSANTRVSDKQIGSGVAGNTLKLSLAKVLSPSVNLNIRLETDNNGLPSGTLVDANAIATIAPASLTTSLADTTLTLGGSVTIAKGTPYHIVAFAGAYGSETVNATNYYKIGCLRNDTATRRVNFYNGINWISENLGGDISDGISASSYYNNVNSRSVNITPKKFVFLKTITINQNFTGNCVLTGGGLNITVSAKKTYTFNIYLTPGVLYNLSFSGGEIYTYSSTSVTSNNFIITDYESLSLSIISNEDFSKQFHYIDTILSEKTLLSKTNAYYTYKLPDIIRIAKDDYAIGELVKYDFEGIINVNATLEKDRTYYISSTPGAISTTPGLNKVQIGKAIATDKISINKKVINLPITVGASPFTRQNITGNALQYYVSGGTVNPIQISKDGTTYITQSTATGYIGTLAPNDYLKVTYTGLPTITYSEL